MTLIASWIRVTPGGEELVVASDSRVTGGLKLDHAPKIFQLERQDAVIAYCGQTIVAYPILLQIKASLDGHEETRSRVLDLVHLKAHIEKVIGSLRSEIGDLPSQDGTNRAFKFLLAGYSWKMSAFRMWTFRYDITTGEFNAHSARKSGDFVFMSDSAVNEKRAVDSLIYRVKKDPKGSLKRLNWQPLEVLFEVIRDPGVLDIGGPPQLVKVYKHANTLPLNIIWPKEEILMGCREKEFAVTHLGRPLLGYERSRYLAMDPESLELIEPWNVAERLEAIRARETVRIQKCLQAEICRAISSLRDKRALHELLRQMYAQGVSLERIRATQAEAASRPFSSWYSVPTAGT